MSRIHYKSARDLEKMREAGQMVSEALFLLQSAVRPGISTYDLDQLALKYVRKRGASPSFLGYRRDKKVFPASICASLNEEVVHGIPNPHRILREGDVLKLDIGIRYKGFHADSATTVCVGKAPDEIHRLLAVTREALWCGIRAIRWRGRLQDVSAAVQQHVEQNGFTVVRQMVGHGVGRSLHEEPQIPNYADDQHPNPILDEGMTLAIEPMVNAGLADIETLPDEWTVVTKDRSVSAHFEHTVAVTRRGWDVLTLGPHDRGP